MTLMRMLSFTILHCYYRNYDVKNLMQFLDIVIPTNFNYMQKIKGLLLFTELFVQNQIHSDADRVMGSEL